MSAQLDPHVRIEWIVAPAVDLEAEWPRVECCAALQQPVDRQPPGGETDDDGWPGRCLP